MSKKRFAVLGLAALATSAVIGVAGAGTASACSVGAPSTAYAASLPQVLQGQSGPEVMGLQLELRKLGYPLTGTGYYGTNTLAAVQDFQRKHGIKDSGIVGSKTWGALVGVLGQGVTHNGANIQGLPQIVPGQATGDDFAKLNWVMSRIEPYAMSFGEGYYGPVAQAAVRDFQSRMGINPSGIVGPKTWAALQRVISIEGGWSC
ncbi:peptidoglycan-binding domain-containing protein [Actinokineospora enzanensis]|uniref:peptidoglycan-binding domain-containing protein n=1 Tax=Actinokineospora enzanensis TaxID=155975 RepID=UPI0003762E88|nr:peptidoglycan-binding protein [Actinokineospora enzanensis]